MEYQKNKELILKIILSIVAFVGVLVVTSFVMRILPLILAFTVAIWLFYNMSKNDQS